MAVTTPPELDLVVAMSGAGFFLGSLAALLQWTPDWQPNFALWAAAGVAIGGLLGLIIVLLNAIG